MLQVKREAGKTTLNTNPDTKVPKLEQYLAMMG